MYTLDDLNEDAPINEHVWKIKRTGKSRDTRYTFYPAGEAIDLNIPEDQALDLDAYLEDLASLDRLKVIEALPVGVRLSKYGGPEKGSNPPRASAAEAEEEEAPVASDRDSRFNAFKEKINKQ